ncbi:unnamed protein product, partial [Polarella glacialis]
ALVILRPVEGRTDQKLAEQLASLELLTVEEFQPVARALVRSFDGSCEFSLELPYSVAVARELGSRLQQFSSGICNRDRHFHRALLSECQDKFESLLQVVDSPSTSKSEAALAKIRLTRIVTFIGHLYHVKCAPHGIIHAILTDLIPSGESLSAEFRVLCSCALLELVGHAFAEVDASYLVAFIGKLVELTAKSSFGAPTRRLVEELREISTTSWQPKRVLTVRAEMVASHVKASCTNKGGEQVCAFNMMAGQGTRLGRSSQERNSEPLRRVDAHSSRRCLAPSR